MVRTGFVDKALAGYAICLWLKKAFSFAVRLIEEIDD
jgi:hypothetical protein